MEDSGTALTRRGQECQVEATEILQALFTSDAASDLYPHYADLHTTGEVCHPSQWSSVFVFGHAAIESALAEGEWLVDNRFSVADVMCASVLQGANARELLRPWTGLEAYVQRSEARPAYARAAAISDRPRS